MHKITTLLSIASFCCSMTLLEAQTNSFANTASNKTWIVSKYYISFSQEDKKDLFNSYSLKFLSAETRTFFAIDNSASMPDTCKGFWNEQSDKVSFSLTLEPNDKNDYKVALLLNKAEMQETEISGSKMSFRIPDVMGYVLVEFTEK